MTADRLGDAAEARIRYACPRHSQRGASADEGFAWDLATCTCSLQRAAILADREARPFRAEHRQQCTKHRCDLTSTITERWYCAVCEAAHADALAEALRTEVEMHSAQHGQEPDICARCGFSYPCGFVRHALPLLAAHDKRRGK